MLSVYSFSVNQNTLQVMAIVGCFVSFCFGGGFKQSWEEPPMSVTRFGVACRFSSSASVDSS